MEVFHFLADTLKDTPLFESTIITTQERTGAIYNDFDKENPFGEDSSDDEEPLIITQETTGDIQPICSQDDVDHALLEAERLEGLFSDSLTFHTELFDCTSETPDIDYLEKVNKLRETGLSAIVNDEAEMMFAIRKRQQWKGPDSVYDAWLIEQGESRSWFPLQQFRELFGIKESTPENAKRTASSGSDSEVEEQSRKRRKPARVTDNEDEVDMNVEGVDVKKEVRFQPNVVSHTPTYISSDEYETEEPMENKEVENSKEQTENKKEENPLDASDVKVEEEWWRVERFKGKSIVNEVIEINSEDEFND